MQTEMYIFPKKINISKIKQKRPSQAKPLQNIVFLKYNYNNNVNIPNNSRSNTLNENESNINKLDYQKSKNIPKITDKNINYYASHNPDDDTHSVQHNEYFKTNNLASKESFKTFNYIKSNKATTNSTNNFSNPQMFSISDYNDLHKIENKNDNETMIVKYLKPNQHTIKFDNLCSSQVDKKNETLSSNEFGIKTKIKQIRSRKSYNTKIPTIRKYIEQTYDNIEENNYFNQSYNNSEVHTFDKSRSSILSSHKRIVRLKLNKSYIQSQNQSQNQSQTQSQAHNIRYSNQSRESSVEPRQKNKSPKPSHSKSVLSKKNNKILIDVAPSRASLNISIKPMKDSVDEYSWYKNVRDSYIGNIKKDEGRNSALAYAEVITKLEYPDCPTPEHATWKNYEKTGKNKFEFNNVCNTWILDI